MPATKQTTAAAEAPGASTWIERFALPLAVSAMEAQPIALLIALLTVLIAGPRATPLFGAGAIALVALGLLWWAMIVERFAGQSSGGKRRAWLHLLGWLVAFLCVVGPYFPSLARGENIFAALLAAVLVTWLWRRALPRAQTGFEYGQIATSFRVGFGILLGILLIAVVLPEQQALRDVLANALPIFFLSGSVALSLVRLGDIRSTHRALAGSQQADPTRPWLLALTIFGVALIAIVIAIESIFSFVSFELVLTALTPLWDTLGTLVYWILYGLVFIVVSPIFYFISFVVGLLPNHAPSKPQQHNIAKRPPPLRQTAHPPTIPPEILVLGRWVFLALVLFLVLLVVRVTLRQWLRANKSEGIEEVREGLDARSLLGQRWREWWNRRRRHRNDAVQLEPLDPTSARARYREMLQEIATAKDDLARNPAETPTEYEARLLGHLDTAEPGAQDLASRNIEPTDSVILDQLTQAYASERYGGKYTEQSQRANLQAWVPRLITRVTGRASISVSRRRARS